MREGFLLIVIGSMAMFYGLTVMVVGGPGSGIPINTVAFYGGVFLAFCGIVRIGWIIGQDTRRGMK